MRLLSKVRTSRSSAGSSRSIFDSRLARGGCRTSLTSPNSGLSDPRSPILGASTRIEIGTGSTSRFGASRECRGVDQSKPDWWERFGAKLGHAKRN